METIVGFATTPRTIKDTFGEYKVAKSILPDRFYTLIGEVREGGFYPKHTYHNVFRDKIYARSIKVRGIGSIRAISIALAFESYEDFNSNPYSCVFHYSLDFDIVDKVALSLGFSKDAPERLTAMVVCKLMETGSTIWTRSQIEAEVGSALSDTLLEAMTFKPIADTPFYVLEAMREAVEVIIAKSHKIKCITGLAGTGKTTTLVQMYNNNPGPIVAFTAKAAKRVNEVLGKDKAMTIHRFIASKPADQSVIYVDEASMVNTLLLSRMMEASDSDSYILIGDYNQLPAIGGGNPFLDFCEVSNGHTTTLDKIWRTDSLGILSTAKGVLDGNAPCDSYSDMKLGQPSYLRRVALQNPSAMYLTFTNSQRGKINRLIRDIVNPDNDIFSYKYRSFAMDDKVMHLKNNYDYGVFNSDMGKVTYIDKYCIGVTYADDVLVYYVDSKYNPTINADVDGRKIAECGAGTIYKAGYRYNISTTDMVEPNMWTVDLAYCLTVHKAQGSEADNVVICVDYSPYLTNQWLYTAITRAKVSCKLLADKRTLEAATANRDTRNTYLRHIIGNGV